MLLSDNIFFFYESVEKIQQDIEFKTRLTMTFKIVYRTADMYAPAPSISFDREDISAVRYINVNDIVYKMRTVRYGKARFFNDLRKARCC